jgi:hypothetical protein
VDRCIHSSGGGTFLANTAEVQEHTHCSFPMRLIEPPMPHFHSSLIPADLGFPATISEVASNTEFILKSYVLAVSAEVRYVYGPRVLVVLPQSALPREYCHCLAKFWFILAQSSIEEECAV